MILLLVSFVAGVLTILAPCVLPLLPVIVGGSLSDDGNQAFNKKKAFTIIISLGLSVIIFTLLLKASTLFIDIPEYVWKWVSGGIIVLFGLVTLFPSLWESRFIARLSIKSNILLGKGNQKNNAWGDIIVGAALGPVFSTCSPTYFIVLATVLPVNFILGLVYLLTYTVGLCLALFGVSVVGKKIMNRLGVVADPEGKFKKVIGVIFIIVGIAIIGGLDKKTQVFILDAGFFDVTKIEQKLLDRQKKSDSEQQILNKIDSGGFMQFLNEDQKRSQFRKAPELSSIDGYINTEGKTVTLADLKGKVVLLDIWTYSCINCQRTLPYINDWYAKYRDQGLEIVGLHTPEFSFERVQGNVQKAVDGFKIKYPVLLDNDYSTWNDLGNRYWPRKYLIDVDGYIVYDHIGEGGYDETEKAIQSALRERSARLGEEINPVAQLIDESKKSTVDSNQVRSPEIYFGSARNSLLTNGKHGKSGVQTLMIPSKTDQNRLYLEGSWDMTPEYAENITSASIVFKYDAKHVYMTAGSDTGVDIEIYLDEKLVKKITVKDETLYQLVEGIDYGKHTLRIVVPKSGLKAFTFTFG